MPYVVKGINRKTGRPTEFTCNVSTEPLARMAADVRGIDVESCTSLEEPRVDELATAAPTDVDPVESPAGRKPDVREWRLIGPQPQARSPRKRCAGVAFAALGLCLAVFYGFDLHAAMAIRDDARLSRRVLGANVRSDYELTFPNHHSVNHSTQEIARRRAGRAMTLPAVIPRYSEGSRSRTAHVYSQIPRSTSG